MNEQRKWYYMWDMNGCFLGTNETTKEFLEGQRWTYTEFTPPERPKTDKEKLDELIAAVEILNKKWLDATVGRNEYRATVMTVVALVKEFKEQE